MANTINAPINTPDVWVSVFATVGTGKMTIAGSGQHCVYTGTPPATLIGHRFTGSVAPFSLLAGEALYVKADSNTTVVITED